MGWLNYEDFKARYPSTTLTEADFPALAGEAEMAINDQTFWRAQVATDEDSLAALATCEAQLIQLALDHRRGQRDPIEPDRRNQREQSWLHGSIRRSGPDPVPRLSGSASRSSKQFCRGHPTRWMLYKGGVYHPRGRRHY